MNRKVKGFMTVEAALLYPYFFMITFLLVRLTVARYGVVTGQAALLYDGVFAQRKLQTTEILRLTDVAFDLFEKEEHTKEE